MNVADIKRIQAKNELEAYPGHYSARGLLDQLGLQYSFPTWFADRCRKYGLSPEDYIKLESKPVDYGLTSQMFVKILIGDSKDLKVLDAVTDSVEYTKSLLKSEVKPLDGFSVENGEIFTTSLYVAEYLGMQHKNVMAAIRREEAFVRESCKLTDQKLPELRTKPGPDFSEDMAKLELLHGFKTMMYFDKNGQARPCYRLSKLATMMLLVKLSPEARMHFVLKFHTYEKQIQHYKEALAYQSHLNHKDANRQFIYVIKHEGCDWIKIGITCNVDRRLREISNASGGAEVLWVSDPMTNAKAVERLAHQHFAEFRKSGEWFSGINSQDVVDFIENQTHLLELM